MFRTVITETPFTSPGANAYFTNITGSAILGDISFLASMRVLLGPRLKEGNSITLNYASTRYRKQELDGVSQRDAIGAITSGYNLKHAESLFLIHNVRGTQDDPKASMKVIEDGFTKLYPEYKRLDIITAFFKKSFPVVCFINEEKRCTVLYVENMDIRKLHYLQYAILAAVPWYHNREDGITKDERDFVLSFSEKEPDKYMEFLKKFSEKYDFRASQIRQMLSDFESKYERRELERIREEISDADRQINIENDSIKGLLLKKNDLCITMLGLEQKIAEGHAESEIMAYFLHNRRLYLEEVDDMDMYFSVKDYLSYYDKEFVERAIRNKTSFVYRNGGGTRSEAASNRAVKLLKAVFLDEKLKVRVCAAYKFTIRGGVYPLTDHQFPMPDFEGYLPNPHINRFGCMNGHIPVINECLRKNEYIGALEQCIASCRNINWGDSAVMSNFMCSIYDSDSAFIELPDGSVVTPMEAAKWLEQQEKRS